MTKVRMLCVVLLLVGGALAQRWFTPDTTPFRLTRFDGEYFPGTRKVYFLGGRMPDGSTTGKIWAFNPDSAKYESTGCHLQKPISNYDICLVRDNYDLGRGDTFGLYVIGSRTGTGANTDTVQAYYPRSNRSRVLTTDTFPGRVGGAIYAAMGSVVAGNKIYVLGGFMPSTWMTTNQCFVFDPLASAGSRWSALPNLNLARCYIAGAVIDDTLLYAIGGDTADGITQYLYARPWVERLNLRNISAGWVRVRSMPMACGETRVYSFQNADSLLGLRRKIVVAGTGQWPAESANCHIYHVAGDSWTAFPKLDSARRNHAGAYIPGTSGAPGVPGMWVWGGRKTSDAWLLPTPEYYVLGRDVGVTRIDAPAGNIDSGAAITPACSVYNYGVVPATYKVLMKIGTFYTDSATVTSHAPGTRQYVSFTNWNANVPRGSYAVSCSTRCVNDMNPANDKRTGSVTVNAHDVGTRMIIRPLGAIDSVATITPACSVYNYGNAPESYTVRMKIGATYDQTAPVTAHAPGTMLLVTFPDWPVGPRGTYAVTCSTQLATDANKVNDKVAAQTTVRIQDVGAIGVMEPVGTVNLNQTVRPKLKVKNLGNTSATFDVQFVINSGASPVYQDSGRVVGLRSGAESTVTFAKTWTATPRGNYTTVGWVRATGDVNPANDTIRGNFSVVEGGGGYPWVAKAPIPGKPVKDGGWLAYNASTRLVYGANGNKSPDFSAYNPTKDSWYPKAGIPPGTEGKPPSKGAAGFGDGNGAIYATKGNNTQGFWKYDCASDAWTQKKDVPLGPSNKKVKGGTDLVVAEDSGGKKSVYLLKGYKNEFYKYDPIADDWRQMPDAPAGGNPKYDKGSWLAYAPHMHKIFAHKAKFHEFYSFNTLTDSWDPAPLKGMPMEGSGGSKKSKDGGCATYHDSALYAFKGGNTQEFWKYSIPANSWTEKETLPKAMKKKVKSGADITTFPLGSDGDLPGTPAELPAIPGNKTNNLWAYSTPGGSGYTNRTPDRDGVMAETGRSLEQFLELVPNPLTGGLLTLRYGLKGGGVAVVCIYDVTGRLALPPALISGRSGTAALDLRSLESGVYLLKARGAGFAAVRKLVIDR